MCLDAGADANARDKFGNRPLHGAAGGDETKIVETLIRRGADPNVRDDRGGAYFAQLLLRR